MSFLRFYLTTCPWRAFFNAMFLCAAVWMFWKGTTPVFESGEYGWMFVLLALSGAFSILFEEWRDASREYLNYLKAEIARLDTENQKRNR